MNIYQAMGNDSIFESLRLWTIADQDPQFVEFRRRAGGGFLIGSAQKKMTARRQLGVLTVCDIPDEPPPRIVVRVLSRRAHLKKYDTLAAPGSFEWAALRMDLDIGELRILAGATPGSVCVLLAADQWGSPPFDWDEYLRTGV